MNKVKQIIPHLLTSGNLVCGCLAILHALSGNLIVAAWLVGIAAVLDFFDGFVARALKVTGEFGKQLDSLADCVTFGVVPGIVMMVILDNSLCVHQSISASTFLSANSNLLVVPPVLPRYSLSYLALLIPVFSAVRLAKFNIDTRQSNSFIGLPTPANSIFMLSIGYLYADKNTSSFIQDLIHRIEFLVPVIIIFSFLLIAELPLFALKFKNFSWKKNEIRYVFMTLSLLLLLCLKITALPLIILLYLVLSLADQFFRKKEKSGGG